jgi:hypothetical protein
MPGQEPDSKSIAEATAFLAQLIEVQNAWLRRVATIIGAVVAIIGTLVSLIYTGMNDHLKSIDEHLTALDNKFETAERSAVKVEDLLAKSPKLEQKIDETHDTVIRLQESQTQIIKLQEAQARIMKEQLNSIQSIQIEQQKMRVQLDNIQKQVRAPK